MLPHHQTWHACNKAYSMMHRAQVYIQSGKAAAEELTQSQAHKVITAMKPKLRNGDMDGAIEQGVIDIGLALAGGSLPDPDEEGWDWGVIIFFAAFGGMLGFAFWCAPACPRRCTRGV